MQGGTNMSILHGCQGIDRTPIPETRTCPGCGRTVEVFTLQGKLVGDVTCPCGYRFAREAADAPRIPYTPPFSEPQQPQI